MADPNHADIMAAIARLDERLTQTIERMDRNDHSREAHLKTLYKRLDKLDATSNVSKGRRAILATLGLAAAGAVGAALTRWIG